MPPMAGFIIGGVVSLVIWGILVLGAWAAAS